MGEAFITRRGGGFEIPREFEYGKLESSMYCVDGSNTQAMVGGDVFTYQKPLMLGSGRNLRVDQGTPIMVMNFVPLSGLTFVTSTVNSTRGVLVLIEPGKDSKTILTAKTGDIVEITSRLVLGDTDNLYWQVEHTISYSYATNPYELAVYYATSNMAVIYESLI